MEKKLYILGKGPEAQRSMSDCVAFLRESGYTGEWMNQPQDTMKPDFWYLWAYDLRRGHVFRIKTDKSDIFMFAAMFLGVNGFPK